MARVKLEALNTEANDESGLESLEVEARDGTVVTYRHPLLLSEDDREALEAAISAVQGATPEEVGENIERSTLAEIERTIRAALLCIADPDDHANAEKALRRVGLHGLVRLLKSYTETTHLGEASPSPAS